MDGRRRQRASRPTRRQISIRRGGAAIVAVLAVSAVAYALLGPELGLGADGDDGAATSSASTPPGSSSPSSTPPPSAPAPKPTNIYRDILPGRFSPAVRGVPERVYVPNSESGTVTEIDPRTFRVIRSFPTGAYDQHVTPAWNLRWLYVDNTTANTLTQIDPKSGRPVRTIPVADPYNLYFTPDGSRAIVVAEGLQRLDFRNPHTWKLIKSVHIPAPGPDHLEFSADGRFFMITCEYAGVVYRVDARRMRVTGKVEVGGLPVDIKLSPRGTRFFVANQGTGGVSVVSARTLHVLRFIHTGRGAHGLAVSRSTRRLYVANRLAGSISVISFATGRVVATWHVGGSPDMLQVSPNGRQLWASNRYNGTVSVIDTSSGRVIHTIVVGSSPHGLAYFPQPGRYSIGHNGVYR